MLRFVLATALALSIANAADVKRPRITGVAHYAIFVADVAKARSFYKDFLGYGEPYDLKNPDGTFSMTFIKINERQYVEIFPEKEAMSDRLNHTSVETDDIEGMRAYLQSKGITVPENKGKNRIGNMSFTIKDPDGHGVEFVQYMPGSFTLREAGKFAGPERISTRMAHFGIIVGALEPAIKFYHDILGFEETWRGSKDGKQLSWVNMKVPDGDDGPAIFTGRTAIYIGAEQTFQDEFGVTLMRGIPVGVSDAAALRLARHADIVVTPPTFHVRGGGCC